MEYFLYFCSQSIQTSMENKQATLELGTKPVGKLLVQYALPAMIAMTAASLYNIVDRVFIGQGVGAMAISGLAITFPFMNLTAAFGAGVGVGASTAISVKLGMVIILLGNVVSHMYFGMNALLRAASKPRQAMYATIFTVMMNVILDALFIIVFKWGIQGAAIATILSQLMAMMWQFKLFSNKNELLHLKKGIYRLRKKLVENILAIGISPFLMNVCACIVVIFINNQLVRFGGDLSVGAYGIANGIAMVFVMFVFGINQGMQPIAGYNYGAQKIDRLMRVLNLSIIAATGIMVTGWLIAMFLPYYCARMFTTDKALIELGIKAIRIVMCCFPIIGFQMVITNFFQCIGKVKISIFLSLSRQLLILLPLLGLLPLFWDIEGVWYSMPISDFSAAVIAAIVMSWYMKKLKRMHRENLLQQEMTEG